MKIVIAMDSFKECMSGKDACHGVKKGFESIIGSEHDFHLLPMADGGEGTVQSLVDATGGEIVEIRVSNPLGEEIDSFYGITGDGKTAIIEMAAASGLGLISQDKRNPLLTSTKGTGELITHAIENGVEHIIMGIGGSATNDCGIGMAQALGVKFYDNEGQLVGEGGGNLHKVSSIDLSNIHPKLKNISFEIACDVDNPLTGPKGSSVVYGPQKGATPEMVEVLDNNLKHFANIIKKDLNIEVDNVPGSGAAGGMGAAALAFLNGVLKPGVDIVNECIGLENFVKDSDLVITGEGRIDHQTIYGKTPIGVSKIAKKHDVPVVAIVGSKGEGYESVYDHGINAVFSIVTSACTLDHALEKGMENIEDTAKNIAKLFTLNK